jgi:hypothetical protein
LIGGDTSWYSRALRVVARIRAPTWRNHVPSDPQDLLERVTLTLTAVPVRKPDRSGDPIEGRSISLVGGDPIEGISISLVRGEIFSIPDEIPDIKMSAGLTFLSSHAVNVL